MLVTLVFSIVLLFYIFYKMKFTCDSCQVNLTTAFTIAAAAGIGAYVATMLPMFKVPVFLLNKFLP